VDTYYATTRTPGLEGGDTSYSGSFNYNSDRYGLQAEHLYVGENFRPEVGFLRREDFRRSFAQARFSPRPRPNHFRAVRRFITGGNAEYFENHLGQVETREFEGEAGLEFMSTDRISFKLTRTYEFVPEAFEPGGSDVTVPVGEYNYQAGQILYTLGTQHTLSGWLYYQYGSFYDGTKNTIGYAIGRYEASSQLAFEPSVSANWGTLPGGDFDSTVAALRTTFAFNPRMFTSALVQYLWQSQSQQQREVALGISAGQRIVRGVQRRPRHRVRPPAAGKPIVCGQSDQAVPLVAICATRPAAPVAPW
jgi:hypothetical protein